MTEKKKFQQKLKLSKKTISVLNDNDLTMINGGTSDPYATDTCSFCNGSYITSCHRTISGCP